LVSLNELEPVVWLVVFVISITAHEAAHAWAAYLGGVFQAIAAVDAHADRV